MIFYKWNDVYNYKDKMFILVDDKFEFTDNCLRSFSGFDIYNKCDYVDNSHNNLLLYFAYKREEDINKWNSQEIFKKVLPIKQHFDTFIFMRNKLYNFPVIYDEMGNRADDIWYEPLLFVKEIDYKQAIRALKLKAIKKQ